MTTLTRAHLDDHAHRPGDRRSTSATDVCIRLDGQGLDGELVVPRLAQGVVIFAHGSGSSRFSPRNRHVAAVLRKAGLGTLLLDLLTMEEALADAQTGAHRFDIDLLAKRLIFATDWLARQPDGAGLPIGYFGASTGAAAALVAAAAHPARVRAVVSRGGRPDLAWGALPHVLAPTLLIVGGDDPTVVTLNHRAFAQLRCPKRIELIPRATHLFEEPGALERVAQLAADWFREHLHAGGAAHRWAAALACPVRRGVGLVRARSTRSIGAHAGGVPAADRRPGASAAGNPGRARAEPRQRVGSL
jgi:dienelactone hydrolase